MGYNGKWISNNFFGIDVGHQLIMIDNYVTETVHQDSASIRYYFTKNKYVSDALKIMYDSVTVSIKEPVHVGLNFHLSQNYPNPFNPQTQISFSVPQKGKVIITVYNVLGQKVARLLNKDMPAGKHKVKFSAHNLSSGVYYYRLQAGNYTATKKMIVLR